MEGLNEKWNEIIYLMGVTKMTKIEDSTKKNEEVDKQEYHENGEKSNKTCRIASGYENQEDSLLSVSFTLFLYMNRPIFQELRFIFLPFWFSFIHVHPVFH